MEEYLFPCMSKRYLGIDCMGCGFQRAFILLIEGEFEQAFLMYPAIYSMLLFFIFIGLQFLDKLRNYNKIIITLGVITAVVMVISYLYKILNY